MMWARSDTLFIDGHFKNSIFISVIFPLTLLCATEKKLEAQKRAAGLLPKTAAPAQSVQFTGTGGTEAGHDFQHKVQQASSIAQQLSKSQQKKLKRQQVQQQQKQQQSS